jgi:carbon-monoxide dehydrogenase iron sulfur subunit
MKTKTKSNQSSISEKKFISADPEKCTGCGVCEIICAIKRENQYNSSYSRIKILRMYRLINLAMTCRLCDNAPCVIACPQKCLVQSEKTGTIIVDEHKCDCCGVCIQVCPHGAISLHPEKDTVLICDLCDGEPQCIEWCPEEALSLVTQKELNKNILKAIEKMIIKETWGLSEATVPKTKKQQSDNQQQPVKKQNQTEKEAVTFFQQTKQKKAIIKSLNLLFDTFSETNPIEILVYGMFVKKHLATIVPARRKEKIEKTLEWLNEAVGLVEEYKLTTPDNSASRNNGLLRSSKKDRGVN